MKLLDEIRDNLEPFVSDDLQVVCISCDPMFTLRAWADAEGYFFPLLSDFWPHGEVARAFGVLNEASGAAMRGTFLVDRDGIVRWTLVNGPGERRDFGALPPRSTPCVDRPRAERCHDGRGRPTSPRVAGRRGL